MRAGRVRVFCYAQHLSGVGHFVRTHALAAGLARAHAVTLVDGGQPVPRPPAPPSLRLLPLPRLVRRDGVLAALDGPGPLAGLLAERERLLADAVAEAPPDLVTVEHYPWSKWELEPEILALILAARRANPAVRVVCSLRDVAPRTRWEAVEAAAHRERVLERLRVHFDALLAHADPAFTRLEEHFPAADRLPVPWAYTGFVTAGPGPMPGVVGDARAGGLVVASAGGGADALPVLRAIIAAFGLLRAQGHLAGHRLLVFRGLHMDGAACRALAAEAREGTVSIEPFADDFSARLASSALSVSQAGYNTCVELLAARVPAVLVPNPRMSDQRIRAERLARRGLAQVVDGDPPAVAALARAMRRALGAPPPVHRFDLGGVARTRRLLEGLCLRGTLADTEPIPALAAGGRPR